MKTIEKLKTFVVLANCHSFTEAAEKLFCSQPSVSMQIQSLEEIFEVKLFDRMGKKIYLNRNGKELLPYAQKMIDIFEEARLRVREQKNLSHNILSICASSFVGIYILPVFLGEFNRLYPNIEAKIQIHSYDQILKYISSNEIEGAYMPFYESQSIDSRLSVELILNDPFELVVSPSHPWVKKDSVSTTDLNTETFLLPHSTSAMKDFVENELKANHISLQNVIQFNDIETIKKGIMMNLGISLIPKRSIASELEQGLLSVVHLEGIKLTRNICFVKHKDKQLSFAGNTFLQMIRDYYLQCK